MTTKKQFVKWFNQFYKEILQKDNHSIDNERLATVLQDFKNEVDDTMFDFYIEDISDTSYGGGTPNTHITWFSAVLGHTVVVTDVEYSYEFEESGEIYDLFKERDEMCMEVKDKLENKYILVEHSQGTDDDAVGISVYRRLEDARKRLEELYEQDKEMFDAEEWRNEESYCLSKQHGGQKISVYITKQKAF